MRIERGTEHKAIQAGIGTYTDPLFNLPITYALSVTLDQMLAWNLPSHVKGRFHIIRQYLEDVH